MKVIDISIIGIKDAVVGTLRSKQSKLKYYAITHGKSGPGCWKVKIPIPHTQLHVNKSKLDLSNLNFELVDLKKKDAGGQGRYLISISRNVSEDFLVLLHPSPARGGVTEYSISGKARVLCEGYDTDNRYLAIHVTGKCEISFVRSGLLMGTPKRVVVAFDGKKWVHKAYVGDLIKYTEFQVSKPKKREVKQPSAIPNELIGSC